MKSTVFDKNNRSGNLLHIETEGCIVNIRIGIYDTDGREVTIVEIIPDRMEGEKWMVDGNCVTRVIRQEEE